MKRFTLLLVVLAVVAFAGTASASDINFSGGVTITQGGTTTSPAANFTFTGLTVFAPGDPLDGTGVSITPNSAFSFTSISGGLGYFSPNAGTISIGGGALGTLTGNINLVTISGSNGFFQIKVDLSNINVTGGSSNLLSSIVGANQAGAGSFTFQFQTHSSAQLNDLLNVGLSGNLASFIASTNANTLRTSVSGSVSVPEPASLFLLGSGLLAGGGFIRRKFKA